VMRNIGGGGVLRLGLRLQRDMLRAPTEFKVFSFGGEWNPGCRIVGSGVE